MIQWFAVYLNVNVFCLLCRAIMGDRVFKNISSGLTTFFKKFRGKDNNNVSFADFRQQFMKYGDTTFKKKVVQPVNKLLKRYELKSGLVLRYKFVGLTALLL